MKLKKFFVCIFVLFSIYESEEQEYQDACMKYCFKLPQIYLFETCSRDFNFRPCLSKFQDFLEGANVFCQKQCIYGKRIKVDLHELEAGGLLEFRPVLELTEQDPMKNNNVEYPHKNMRNSSVIHVSKEPSKGYYTPYKRRHYLTTDGSAEEFKTKNDTN